MSQSKCINVPVKVHHMSKSTYNINRHDACSTRPQDDEVTVEHLIVGILLFTPVVALLPTLGVWYLYVTLLHGAVVAARLALYLLIQARGGPCVCPAPR